MRFDGLDNCLGCGAKNAQVIEICSSDKCNILSGMWYCRKCERVFVLRSEEKQYIGVK